MIVWCPLMMIYDDVMNIFQKTIWDHGCVDDLQGPARRWCLPVLISRCCWCAPGSRGMLIGDARSLRSVNIAVHSFLYSCRCKICKIIWRLQMKRWYPMVPLNHPQMDFPANKPTSSWGTPMTQEIPNCPTAPHSGRTFSQVRSARLWPVMGDPHKHTEEGQKRCIDG